MATNFTAIKIYNEIKELVLERYVLGLNLGIPKYKVDIITEKYRDDAEIQMINILDTWLKMDPEASWKKLATTIHNMGYRAVADRLQPLVDEESISSMSEDIENRNANIDACTREVEETRKELVQNKIKDDEPPDDPDECASQLQRRAEKAKSKEQRVIQLMKETNTLQQDLTIPYKITEEMKQRLEERIHHLKSEREDVIFNEFDQILEQMDAITDELKIRESTTTKHKQRMAKLDATKDKLDAIDKQLKDCQRVLKIVDARLQEYNEQIARLTQLQEEYGLILSQVKKQFCKCLTDILKFAERVDQWQSQVEKKLCELQAEQTRLLHFLRRGHRPRSYYDPTVLVLFPRNSFIGALFGSGRDQQMQERLYEIEHKLEINERIKCKCDELLQTCLDLCDKYAHMNTDEE